MCTTVHFVDKDIFIGTVRGLADTLDIEVDELIWENEQFRPIANEASDYYRCCLCTVNIEATMAKCGYGGNWCEHGNPDCFEALRMN